jgi:hypothetical protein
VTCDGCEAKAQEKFHAHKMSLLRKRVEVVSAVVMRIMASYKIIGYVLVKKPGKYLILPFMLDNL